MHTSNEILVTSRPTRAIEQILLKTIIFFRELTRNKDADLDGISGRWLTRRRTSITMVSWSFSYRVRDKLGYPIKGDRSKQLCTNLLSLGPVLSPSASREPFSFTRDSDCDYHFSPCSAFTGLQEGLNCQRLICYVFFSFRTKNSLHFSLFFEL